jgi:hypothetical protein
VRELIQVCELLLPLRMVPAEEGEVIDQRFWQVSLCAVVGDARGAVTFGELLAVGTEDDAEVDEPGFRRAESPLE